MQLNTAMNAKKAASKRITPDPAAKMAILRPEYGLTQPKCASLHFLSSAQAQDPAKGWRVEFLVSSSTKAPMPSECKPAL